MASSRPWLRPGAAGDRSASVLVVLAAAVLVVMAAVALRRARPDVAVVAAVVGAALLACARAGAGGRADPGAPGGVPHPRLLAGRLAAKDVAVGRRALLVAGRPGPQLARRARDPVRRRRRGRVGWSVLRRGPAHRRADRRGGLRQADRSGSGAAVGLAAVGARDRPGGALGRRGARAPTTVTTPRAERSTASPTWRPRRAPTRHRHAMPRRSRASTGRRSMSVAGSWSIPRPTRDCRERLADGRASTAWLIVSSDVEGALDAFDGVTVVERGVTEHRAGGDPTMSEADP